MNIQHNGGDVQAIEYVAQHTFGVALVANDIIDYKRRIILGPRERDGKRKPLLDPSGTSTNPKSRLVGMLPAVARMVIAKFDNFDGLLQQAVHLFQTKVLTEGSPTKAALKRRVSSLETESHTTSLKRTRISESLLKVKRRSARKR